ncbi:putative dolichyl pyrophosphate Man9GlcNAc2 alpha-1 [Chlorella vulgaris]
MHHVRCVILALAAVSTLSAAVAMPHNVLETFAAPTGLRWSQAAFLKDSGIEVTYNTSELHHSGDWVKVAWKGVLEPQASDMLAVFCPPDAYEIGGAAVKYANASDSPGYLESGAGSTALRLVNLRCDMRIVLLRADTSTVIAVGPVLHNLNPNEPTGVHLMRTQEPTEMLVQFTTRDKGQPVVQYSYAADDAQRTQVPATTTTYKASDLCGPPASTFGWVDPGHLHTAAMTALQPGRQVFYRVGDAASGIFSPAFSFHVPPVVGSDTTVRMLVLADQGVGEVDGSAQAMEYFPAAGVAQLMVKDSRGASSSGLDFSLVLHVGDIAYARGFGALWDAFLFQQQELSSRVPYMVAIGNHERDHPNQPSCIHPTMDSGGECGVPFEHRWPMPFAGPDQPWFSFDHGPVHFTVMSTEHSYEHGSPQHAFLTADLASVHRGRTPWLVLLAHRPFYIDADDAAYGPEAKQSTAKQLQMALEDLLAKHGVDLCLAGHHHSYQRTCPVYKNTCQDQSSSGRRGIVHLCVGNAGAQFYNNGFPETPNWIMHEAQLTHGYARFEANRTHFRIEALDSQGDSAGRVFDEVTLTRFAPNLNLFTDAKDVAAMARAEMEVKARALREEERRKKLAELEEQLIEAETTARVQAWVESKVTDALGSDVVQRSLQQRLEQERKLLEQQVHEELNRERQLAEEAERGRREAIDQQKLELRKLEEERQQMEQAVKAKQQQEEEHEAQRRFAELAAKMREADEWRRREQQQEKERREKGKNRVDAGRPKFSFKLGYSQMKLRPVVGVALAAALVRWAVSLHDYSGLATPPRFGDYEAQRHWMEITSWLCGKFVQRFEPKAVELRASRGYESPFSKFLLRQTVLAADALVALPAALAAAVVFGGGSNGRRLQLLVALLFSPATVLIDHGHFQYNCIGLGLAMGAAAAAAVGHDVLCSVLFSLSLNHKQMGLYYAPAFFAYLFGRCLQQRTPGGKVCAVARLGVVVALTFGLVWAPWLRAPGAAWLDVLRRVFPTQRGLYEDYVANWWCTSSRLIKWTRLLSQARLLQLCSTATLATAAPAMAMQLLRPSPRGFLLCLAASATAFFLFSYQVHEKSILLPLLPLSMLFGAEDPQLLCWINVIATFSMAPLLQKDRLGLAAIGTVAACIAAVQIAQIATAKTDAPRQHRGGTPLLSGRRIQQRLIQLSFLGCVVLLVAFVMLPPPQHLPFLYDALIVTWSFLHIAALFAYVYILMLQEFHNAGKAKQP